MKFNFIYLGQSVLRYETPLDIFLTINSVYEQKFNKLRPANDQLAGKIKNEHSLYDEIHFEGKIKINCALPKNVIDWFESMFNHYLHFNGVSTTKTHLNSIWVNEMKAHEYNPVHIHQGALFTGLSSVMILKLPDTFGVEYSASETPSNGKLNFLGNASGQFCKTNYEPPMKLRDFYIFPYDMRHCVYPFNGTNETRRTLAANYDVDYNPFLNQEIK
jgi:hypothetical protein